LDALLLLVGVLLERRACLISGGIGISIYLGHLGHLVFSNRMLFPFLLMGFGPAVMALGWAYQRQRAARDAMAMALLPG